MRRTMRSDSTTPYGSTAAATSARDIPSGTEPK